MVAAATVPCSTTLAPYGGDACASGQGDCCTDNGSPSCDDPTCCGCVCAIDPFCCETSWDSICALEAADECAASCSCGAGGGDSDADGVPDAEDACADSIMDQTVVFGTCDSGVANQVSADGCTFADRIAECADGAVNHGDFVSCVAHLANDWKQADLITGQEKGRMQSCAARFPGDLDADAAVGMGDLAELLQRWGQTEDGPPDFDDDGVVDMDDLLFLIGAWGPLP